MRAKVITFVVLAVLLMVCATPAYGQEVPPLPHAFYGTVEINDSAASVGTRVEARGEGVRTGIEGNPIATAAAGIYGSPDPMGPKLIVQGDILDGAITTFYVNGVSTEQTAEWHSGEVTGLNLTVTIPRPPGVGIGPADTTPPRISNVLLCLEGVTETTADICWTTNEKSTSQVEYWTSPSVLSPLDETRVIYHHVQLTDLTPGTTYYYKTMSMDRADNLAESDEYTFTTLGKPPAALFTSSNLSISPIEVYIGEPIIISILITNAGDAAGSYKVTLKIDGVVEASEEITLNAGTSQEVTFTTSKDVAKTYTVDVNGLSGSFTVKEKPAPPPPPPILPPVVNWPLIWGIIGGVVLVSVIIFLVVRKRRA